VMGRREESPETLVPSASEASRDRGKSWEAQEAAFKVTTDADPSLSLMHTPRGIR
jgi:hypothetical protein